MAEQTPTPPEPPAPEQVASRTDRRLEFRVALIGVTGALLGALIGGAATLVGSIYQQHSAAASQLQAERQNSYIAYDVAMDSFDGDVTGVLLQAKLDLIPTKYVNKVIADEGTLQHAADQVSILASPQLLSIVRGQQKAAEILDIEA